MTDDITTRPMLEALLQGQRQLGLQMGEFRAALAAISQKQDDLAAKQDGLAAKQDALAAKQIELATKQDALFANQVELATKQDALFANQVEIAAKQDALAVKQDNLQVRVAELTRQIEDGFDDTNRKIEIFNDRLLSFEGWLKKVDRRLHDEILVRTR
jgi:chromosome segregation ATPase